MSFNPVKFSCTHLYILYSVWMKGKKIQLDRDYYNKYIIYNAFNKVNWLMLQRGLHVRYFQGLGDSK